MQSLPKYQKAGLSNKIILRVSFLPALGSLALSCASPSCSSSHGAAQLSESEGRQASHCSHLELDVWGVDDGDPLLIFLYSSSIEGLSAVASCLQHSSQEA